MDHGLGLLPESSPKPEGKLFYTGQEVRIKGPLGKTHSYGIIFRQSGGVLRLWQYPNGPNTYCGTKWVKPIE